ncbi:ferulic acid esterase [Ktedonosporobacter rubrisoli]|uniref:Ferulic acid esterase n=1 Tax=Ktedonosporobacter rubrisoli TaxID=2509675 RepID=A0A4V0YZ19_KTERU|nr:PHB depolymerase family esterase [Ktedonosporobacter rubrisoli]QBD78181.1 ferulic acid esterase [Ktedonosporobacter rubrisoli]
MHIPGGYHNREAYPLVLNFHGHGSNASVQERMTGMSRLADQRNFVVVYPQGSVGLDMRTGWNTGPWNYPHVDDVLFTSDLINRLQETLCINPQRIYAVGFSNGGGLTNILACKLAGRIAGFAIVSGGMHPVTGGCRPSRPVSLLEFHGTGDHVVPYTGNRANDDEPPIAAWLAGWVSRDGCTGKPTILALEKRVMREQWSPCRGDTHIILYRISNGQHTWPRRGAVPDADGHVLDVTPIIWNFFQLHTLSMSNKPAL